MRLILRVSKIILLLCLCSPVRGLAQEQHWHKTQYLLKSFTAIALNNEFNSAQTVVRKWQSTIHYYFDHRVDDKALNERLAVLHMQHLSVITGINFQRVYQKQRANLLIVFSKEGFLEPDLQELVGFTSAHELKNIIESSICLASFVSSHTGSIKQAVILIPVDRARAHGKLVSCIVEELTQILGLPNDSVRVYPSIFNDKSVDSLLTGLDYLLLKMLYDSRVQAGMSRQQVLPIIKSIIATFRQQNIIKRADKLVRRGGLYPLLDCCAKLPVQ